jgi:alkylated DNA repair dioxygenase AlkB
MKPVYIEKYVDDPGSLYNELLGLTWIEATPARKEYFMSDNAPLTYSYGSGKSVRTYSSVPYLKSVERIRKDLDHDFGTFFNVCFLNRYDEQKNALDYHSDDSPEMNHNHPIMVISLGASREIWWKHKDVVGNIPDDNKKLLESGSLFVMPSHFQEDHVHKIPKCDRVCGTRISLTFRNYILPPG